MTLNKEFHLINPTNLEYILYSGINQMELFNDINYNIGLADKAMKSKL